MNPGFKRYLELKKRYIAEHGEAPPKGTNLDQLEKLVGNDTTKKSGCSCSHGKSAGSAPSTKGVKLFRFM